MPSSRHHVTVAAIASCASVLYGGAGLGPAMADPIDLEDITAPDIETFEGVLAVIVKHTLFMGFVGPPPAGTVLPSGLEFVSPDPNPFHFFICDYRTGDGSFGLCDNGTIEGSADLLSGTAFAGTGGAIDGVHAFRFEFPTPVANFGVFASACDLNGGLVTLTTFDPDGRFIEQATFETVPVPLTDDHFMGLGGGDPIGGFARRLQDQLSKLTKDQDVAGMLETPTHYANIIINEVERLERLLQAILCCPKPTRWNWRRSTFTS